MTHIFEGPDKTAEDFERERLLKRMFILAETLNQKEKLPFPGLTVEAYTRMKADEEKLSPEEQMFVTLTDDVVKRCLEQGIVVARNSQFEIYVIPRASKDPLGDCMFARHLDIEKVEDPDLKELILADQAYKAISGSRKVDLR
jgi:hypothetical protein